MFEHYVTFDELKKNIEKEFRDTTSTNFTPVEFKMKVLSVQLIGPQGPKSERPTGYFECENVRVSLSGGINACIMLDFERSNMQIPFSILGRTAKLVTKSNEIRITHTDGSQTVLKK